MSCNRNCARQEVGRRGMCGKAGIRIPIRLNSFSTRNKRTPQIARKALEVCRRGTDAPFPHVDDQVTRDIFGKRAPGIIARRHPVRNDVVVFSIPETGFITVLLQISDKFPASIHLRNRRGFVKLGIGMDRKGIHIPVRSLFQTLSDKIINVHPEIGSGAQSQNDCRRIRFPDLFRSRFHILHIGGGRKIEIRLVQNLVIFDASLVALCNSGNIIPPIRKLRTEEADSLETLGKVKAHRDFRSARIP